ncbi:MAG TPA: RNA polymerase sigma factor [Flavobacterium sp.]|nr:RNA polymerase sigma factor [Flavobacterium sp.]
MNLFVLNFSEVELIDQVMNQNRLAQKQLFEQFSPTMLGTCRQYIKDFHDAEDVMLHAFMKVFQYIGQYKNEGSFEGWIRRIMIRECISFLKQKKELTFIEDVNPYQLSAMATHQDKIDDYQVLIDQLPKGCKYVFVLYVIEGYKHQEIAELLNISVGTSKSQLAYAKKILKQQIEFKR